MLLFNWFLEVVVEGEYKGICAVQEENNMLKKVQPNYAIPLMQINTSLMSFRARGLKEHIHADGWSEREEKTKPWETWMASRQCFLSREPTWNWVLCPVSCNSEAPRENYSILGHFCFELLLVVCLGLWKQMVSSWKSWLENKNFPFCR